MLIVGTGVAGAVATAGFVQNAAIILALTLVMAAEKNH